MPVHQMDVDGFKSDLFLLSYGPLEPMVINLTCARRTASGPPWVNVYVARLIGERKASVPPWMDVYVARLIGEHTASVPPWVDVYVARLIGKRKASGPPWVDVYVARLIGEHIFSDVGVRSTVDGIQYTAHSYI